MIKHGKAEGIIGCAMNTSYGVDANARMARTSNVNMVSRQYREFVIMHFSRECEESILSRIS